MKGEGPRHCRSLVEKGWGKLRGERDLSSDLDENLAERGSGALAQGTSKGVQSLS